MKHERARPPSVACTPADAAGLMKSRHGRGKELRLRGRNRTALQAILEPGLHLPASRPARGSDQAGVCYKITDEALARGLSYSCGPRRRKKKKKKKEKNKKKKGKKKEKRKKKGIR
jgi:hypothetical protein